MKLLVGLGNPGAKYVATRHNIGFIAIDAIAEGQGRWREKFQAEEMRLRLGGKDAVLLKPQTFMNNSGQSVGAAAKFYKIEPADVIVFHDELDLAPGQVKLKKSGGHAGHNGLRSIIAHIGADFHRVRIGIGHPGDKTQVVNYVLHEFAKLDQDWIAHMQDNLPDAIMHLIAGNDSRFIEVLRRGAKIAPKTSAKSTRPVAVKAENKPESSSPFETLKELFRRD